MLSISKHKYPIATTTIWQNLSELFSYWQTLPNSLILRMMKLASMLISWSSMLPLQDLITSKILCYFSGQLYGLKCTFRLRVLNFITGLIVRSNDILCSVLISLGSWLGSIAG